MALVAAGRNLLIEDGAAHRAAGLLQMPAILEAAAGAKAVNFEETPLRRAREASRRREVPNAGSIDERRLRSQGVPTRRGGRMPPLIIAGQFGGLRRGLGDQGVYQGGLADAGLAD